MAETIPWAILDRNEQEWRLIDAKRTKPVWKEAEKPVEAGRISGGNASVAISKP